MKKLLCSLFLGVSALSFGMKKEDTGVKPGVTDDQLIQIWNDKMDRVDQKDREKEKEMVQSAVTLKAQPITQEHVDLLLSLKNKHTVQRADTQRIIFDNVGNDVQGPNGLTHTVVIGSSQQNQQLGQINRMIAADLLTQ